MTNHTAAHSAHHEEATDRIMFGFWVYIMTDLLMFAVLFASYAVLKNNTMGGPAARDLFSPTLGLINTLILLTSSFTVGIGMLAAKQKSLRQVYVWFGLTFILGLAFLGIEMYEFAELLHHGHSWTTNSFLSSFFALIGTHGLHIVSGLLWLVILLAYIAKRGLTATNIRKLALLSLFWHFLDIVWIFIFSVVYLGAMV